MIFPDLRALDTHIKAGALLPVYLLLRHTVFFLRISFLWLVAGFALTAFTNTQLLRLQLKQMTPDEDL